MKLSDLKGLFKKTILTIESVENPYEDYYTVQLKFESGVTWIPGEHAIFKLLNKTVTGKKWRAFSLASIPEENFVMIGTRTGEKISSFKKELTNMKKGDKVSMRGPFGWFKLKDESSPIVLFASGVGVTPVRAFLKKVENSNSRSVEIIYASSDYYLFGEELEIIAKNNSKINLYKTKTRKESSDKLNELAKKYNNQAYYYISGSLNTIKSIKTTLKKLGIKGNRIINDFFFGY